MRNAWRLVSGMLTAVILLSLVAVGGSRAEAQELLEFEYAAKIVCGAQERVDDTRLARGFYATTINIHNPNSTEVTLLKKLSLTFPPGFQKPGPVLQLAKDVLKPDQALETDCMDIRRRVPAGTIGAPYFEGFVVIQSASSLDVTAVYTTATLNERPGARQHSSIDVEQIRERRRTRGELADLVPVPNAQGNFCVRQGDKLLVTVRNQGAGPAGPSVTEVNFGAFGTLSMPTPPLAPGASAPPLAFTIPASPNCFNPDCEFQITVDSTLQVPESNEGNNVAKGICLG